MQEHEVRVAESGKSDIEADDYEEMLKARIPLNKNPRKASYLSYRASGFSVREAQALVPVSGATVKQWRREDPEFREWESGEKLAWLQHNISSDLMTMEFMRNFRLALRMDFKILYRANYNFAGMTDNEIAMLKVIRKHYAPQDLMALQRALQPDSDALPPGTFREKVTWEVEGRIVEDENARRAAARDLLERFQATGKIVEATPEIEGPNGEKPFEGEVVN